MQKDKHITKVMFRKDITKDFKGSIFAIFPYEINHQSFITTYQHIGQHSSGDYDYCIKSSKPATEEEYKDLFEELESIGYNLKIVNKK